MRIFFSLIFLALSLFSSATTYYIDPAGSNSNNGTVESPWKTLSHACSQATKSGDIIHVNAGIYLESDRCDLATGVSIEGVGDASHIVSHYVTSGNTNGFVTLESLIEGTNGNQSISYIKLDGDLTGTIAMYVLGRSNVKIHHCTVVDFTDSGIGFRGGYPVYIPNIYATGNEIYNCTIENSSSRIGVASHGLIRISGQSGMLVHDNILIQTSRPAGQNGNIVDAVEGHNKGLKYYNNKSYKPVSEGSAYNFHIESWNTDGGIEIFYNEFHGGGCHIDVAGHSNTKGAYDYSWWIHDNLFMMDSQMARIQGEPYVVAISFEATNEDAIISNNHFKNLPYGIYHTINQSDRWQKNISIYSNLFENMGYSNNDWAFAIIICTYENLATPSLFSNFHIYNNTITSGIPGRLTGGIHIQKTGSVSDIYIRNNIITNCSYPYYIYNGTGTLSNIHIQNNVLFGNGNNNNIYNIGNISNYVNEVNIIADPLFASTSDFRLKSGSPAIDAGINVGLPYYGSSPDIGAFEMSDGELQLNKLPIVNISSPTKGLSFTSPATVTIDVEAYDPDGTISKVELFNGENKIAERTSAPYSFTLKDLPEGSYILNAVATDNLKSATTSPSVEFKVTSYNENREYFNLYPNPNDGRFSINFTSPLVVENYTVTIVNIIGKTVYRQELSKTEDTTHFDLSHLNPGTYVLMITSNAILLTQKFIKA
jgi:hypothetical protein